MASANHNPPRVQVTLTKQIACSGWQVNIGKSEDGGRVLQLIDPGAGAVYNLPLPPEVARKIGQELISSVPIAGANEMPGSGE